MQNTVKTSEKEGEIVRRREMRRLKCGGKMVGDKYLYCIYQYFLIFSFNLRWSFIIHLKFEIC